LPIPEVEPIRTSRALISAMILSGTVAGCSPLITSDETQGDQRAVCRRVVFRPVPGSSVAKWQQALPCPF